MRWQDYVLLLLMGGALLVYFRQRRRVPRGRRSAGGGGRRRERLTRREEAAWRILQTRGYRLEDIHPCVPVTLTVEDKSRHFTHSGGFIVGKGGKSFLVKIKRGEGTPLTAAELRRELILDFLFFQPAGLFLYDGEKDRLQELHLSFGGGSAGGKADNRLLQLSLLLLIAVGVALLYRLLF